jgi:endonuclease-3
MSTQARSIYRVLCKTYPEVNCELDFQTPFQLLCATVLSAQCTDVRVNKITPLLFSKADNPFDMIKLTVEEIKNIIRPCGLSPMKSKGIHGLSKILIEKHNGQVPKTFNELEELPAVGHKTASVVMSQAFDIPAFPVDTHIHRLMYRWNLTNGKNVIQTEKDAKRLFPKELWNDLHLQIIWYGREYSPARAWDLDKDIITNTIGRKSVIKEYFRKNLK